jgi:hypothetical protein
VNLNVNSVIKIIVTFNKYVPLVLFYNENKVEYGNINTNKYIILNKDSNNNYNIYNIRDNKLLINNKSLYIKKIKITNN